MAFETGTLIDVRIAEETDFGVPVAPPTTKALPVISCNFTDEANLVPDPTAFSQDPDLRDEKPAHNTPTFELVLGIPRVSSGTAAADSAFIDLMEFALGAVATISSTIPTYTAGDAFINLSGNTAIRMLTGSTSIADSFVIYKNTISGHETAYGCVIGNITFRGALDDFVIVTITGECKGVSKMMGGLSTASLVAASTSFTADDQAKGRVGVGSFIAFMSGMTRAPSTGGRVVTAFNPETREGSYAGTSVGALATPTIIDALGTPVYTDYQEESIFADGTLVSVDGGEATVGVTGWEVSIDTGARAYNRSGASLSPVSLYQQNRRFTLSLDLDVDIENSQIEKLAERNTIADVQILAGGVPAGTSPTAADAGTKALFRFQNCRLRRNFPQMPREGLSSVRYTGMALASGFGTTKEHPLAMYIR